MKFKSLAVASVVALTALSSQAASTDWAAHDALEIGSNFALSGSLFDTYSFTLGAQSTVTSGAIVSFGNLVGASYNLYSYGTDGVMGTGDDVGLGAWTFNSTAATHSLVLSAGQYFYSVSGGAMAPAAYSIASAVTAAPVPEPETYAMLGAGLAAIGFIVTRRRRDN